MSDALVFECELDAPPEKVWRALTIREYLERWLVPDDVNRIKDGVERIDYAVISSDENKSLSYRWRESGTGIVAGVEDSVVTFELSPTEAGGTWFRLTHEPLALPVAANNNQEKATLLLVA